MAKQIKVIKCPQCGSADPISLGNNHYKCRKCGSEFILDNDDININIHHTYDVKSQSSSTNNNKKNLNKLLLVISFIIAIMIVIPSMCFDDNDEKTTKKKEEYSENYIISALMNIKGRAVSFYKTNRRYSNYYTEHESSVFYVFRDVETGEILKEQKSNDKQYSIYNVKMQYFSCDSTYYLILESRTICKIDLNTLSVVDVTSHICSLKPALNTGLSSVYFLNYDQGEGFRVVTNLGKEYYYFTQPNKLYSTEAFRYVTRGGMSTISDSSSTEKIMYLFDKTESESSSSVLQLMEIKYKYNLDGPQRLIIRAKDTSAFYKNVHRLTSIKPVSDKFIGFTPSVLLHNDKHILIFFYATLAEDSPSKVQLLTTKGEVLWTRTLDCRKYLSAIKTDQGFILQTEKKTFYMISKDGRSEKIYEFPEKFIKQ